MVLPTHLDRPGTPRRRIRRVGGVLLAVAAAVVLVGAYAYYRAEIEEIVLERHQAMSAIAELKASQVVRWCDHLKEHVSAAAANRVLVRALVPAGPAAAGGRRDLETLDDLLAFFQGHHDYDTVLLLTPGAEVLAGAGTQDSAVPPATRVAAHQALGSDVPVLSTFFRGSDGAIYIDALAAVRDAAGVPLAVLVFRTNASATLHPLIQNWPTPSQSGETLLVAADGDQVVFLNELRHRSNTALTFRLPRSNRSLPAVQAVEGRVGQFSGWDYRGVEVLADLRPLAGTPWFLVAKIDRSEIVAEARSRAGAITLVAVLVIGLAAAATAYFYAGTRPRSISNSTSRSARPRRRPRRPDRSSRRARNACDWRFGPPTRASTTSTSRRAR